MRVDGRELAGPLGPPHRLLDTGLATDADARAIESRFVSLTWRQLDDVSASVAHGYLAAGLRPGDRIATLMPNRVALIAHYLACLRAGLVAVPLNYRYTPREIDHALEVSGATLLLGHAEREGDLSESRLAGGDCRVVLFRDDLEAATLGFPDDVLSESRAELPVPEPTAPASIFFTSGSTGPAKGVTHTHESLGWMLASAVDALELTAADAFLPASSMSHLGGFLWALCSLAVGGRVVVTRTMDAEDMGPLLREHAPTVMAMLPAALVALVRSRSLTAADFTSLRLVRSGSDKVSREVAEEFARTAGFAIDEGYGMTEVGLATLNPPSGTIKQGSVGQPVAGFSLETRAEDGRELRPHDVGRVFIRTRSRMAGYWGAPEATEEVLDADWIDSGDLMSVDEDGYFWFFGRKKQIIVHDGSNISPYEVEDALQAHPAVALAAAIGVRDAVHGETVRSYVTLRPGVPAPREEDLIRFARERIGYKAPEEVLFLDEMPLNPTGKLDRVGLRRLAEEHLHPHLAGPPEASSTDPG